MVSFKNCCDVPRLKNKFPRDKITSYLGTIQFLPRELCSARYMTYGRVSVCLSVSDTSRYSTKMAKHRNMQTTPHDSPGNLVF